MRTKLAAVIIIVVCGWIAYSNSFSVPFVYDDLGNIVYNEALRVFDFTVWQNYFGLRAIPQITFALNLRLDGLNVFGYHLVNWAIHVLNGVLIYWLCTALGRHTYGETPGLLWGGIRWKTWQLFALLAALLFVSHPIATESVTYVVQRTVSLTAFFYLLALAAYVRGRLVTTPSPRHPPGHSPFVRGRKILWLALALLAAAAAMHSKQTAITLPVAIMLIELLFFARRERWQRSAFLLVPWLVLLLYLPWRLFGPFLWSVTGLSSEPLTGPAIDASGVVSAPAAAAAGHATLSRWSYLLTQFSVLLTYLRLLVWPAGQSIDHDFTAHSSLFAAPVLLGAGLAAALLGLAWLLRRRCPLTAFGIFLFLLALAPESSLIPLLEVVAEYRLYLPLAGSAIVAADLIALLHTNVVRHVWVFGAGAIVVAALVSATWVRNTVWQDPARLWSDAVAKAPAKARPYNNLGVVLLERGDVMPARDHFQQAIELSPGYAHAHHNLATSLAKLGDLEGAAQHYNEAYMLQPTTTATQVNLAIVYLKLGRVDEAQALVEAVIINDERSASAQTLLGAIYWQQGQRERAREAWQKALVIDPAHSSARRNLELTQ